MTEPNLDNQAENISLNLRVKPLCKPDVQLKKSRHRIFNEHSIDLSYSFGYQCSFGTNLSVLKENVIILISGNYLNFLNTDTMTETFLPSTFGAGFSCTSVHPSTFFFAAAEKGPKFCINIVTYPALDICKTLRNDSTIMSCCAMQFHPQGDLLVTLSHDPENMVSVWYWQLEAMLYASEDSARPVYSMHFSTNDEDVFMVSGEGHVTFWSVDSIRDDRDTITEILVTQTEELCTEPSKLDIYCTVSVADSFLSAITDGYLLLWNSASLCFEDAVKIAMPDDKPCHNYCINHVIIQRNYIITFGSDGYFKFWDYNELVSTLTNTENEVEPRTEEDDVEQNENGDKNEEDDFVMETKIEIVYIEPVKEFFISDTSDLIYGVIMYVKYDVTRYLIQDKNGALYQADISDDLSRIYLTQLLCGLGSNIVGLTSCPVYPYVSVASSLGSAITYDCSTKEVFKSGNFSLPITCILWPSAKVELYASSFIVGFADGTIRWIAICNDVENYILKFVIKPHINEIQFLKMNDNGTILISQGLDSKLYFYSVENFLLTPLGFYINHHEVVDFAWLKYVHSSNVKYKETLLIFCKYSYLIETEIPDPTQFQNSTELKKTYFIENKQYQVYKINGLRKYHELGDRIHDSDCEEQSDLNEAGKEVLRKLKYEEKKERRENHRINLGLSGPITPSEILSYLPALDPKCIWLSLGKEDFGYIFEFEFQGQFGNEPVELIPIRALEILTAETIPVLAMQYSPCGKFIFMGLQDGSLNVCYLENAFMPDSGYDFAHYQIHDPDVGAVNYVAVSHDGSFITTAGCDGNILLFRFNLLDYKNVEEYGEKPSLSDTSEVEDISSEKLSLEDELKRGLNEKYQEMKEQRKCALENLKEEYLILMEEFNEYSNLCEESFIKLNCIPEELKINPENFSVPSVAVEMFSKTTKILIQDASKEFQTDLLKATLLYEKYCKCFKSRIKYEKFSVNCISEDTVVSTFRGCEIPQNIKSFQLASYPKMYKPVKTDKGPTDGKKRKEKINAEKLKLEQELVQTQKALIDYPSNTPVSELISKYNQRKEQHIEKLKEHIRGYEILEKISISDKMKLETTQEIEVSHFKFKDSKEVDQQDSEFICTFAEKKAKTILYYLKAYKLWTFFNSLLYSAYEKKSQIDVNENIDYEVEKSEYRSLLVKKTQHIYFKRGKKLNAFMKFTKVKWTAEEGVFYDEIKAQESFLLETKAEKIKKQQKIYDNFLSMLSAVKSKMCCEKKFHDIRFNLKCIELNIFKTELKSEKKLLKIINELEDQLYAENQELSTLEETIHALKNRRQVEKTEWMNIYKQFRKTIGLKHKHKGYLKKLFKKKIRPEQEKAPYKRHPSSESSESEVNIESDDDSQNVDKKDLDQNLLKEVMYFRLKRHEVEKRMKGFKRNILINAAKEATLQRRIQRVKDALGEAWNELKSIPVNRKLEWKYITWPAVLYPENVHKEFYGKEMSCVEDIKIAAYKEMSLIHETITKELKPINKLIRVALILVTDIVVKAELSDLIDIACVFFSLVDKVSEEVDEYFKKLTSSDSVDILQEETELEKKPVNIIREILSAAAEKSDLKLQPNINSDSIKADLFEREESQSWENIKEILKEEDSDQIFYLEKVKTNVMFDDEKQTLKSWRDVPDDNIVPFNEKLSNEFDINSIITQSVPILDCSLLVDENYSSSEDYYLQELYLDQNICDQGESVLETGQSFMDYAKLLIELDIQEVVEDMISNISEEELINNWKKPLSDSFPTNPGGGLVLSKDVLLSMENEDPDGFPYSNFYQEQVFTEESVEKPKVVHIVPHHKDSELVYDMPLAILEDFILLNLKDVLNSLNAFNQIKMVTSELEEQNKLLEKKVLKAKANRVNAEQELLAVMRERTEEIHSKFSRMVNLELLLDVIENPHLRIKKYETDLKLESLKNDFKKLKAAEISALKSLDKFGFEDTVICHELLELRLEYKMLNKKYSSKLKNIPVTGKKLSAITE